MNHQRTVGHQKGAAQTPRNRVQLGFVIFPGFPMACVTSAIEPMRAANDLHGTAHFGWSVWPKTVPISRLRASEVDIAQPLQQSGHVGGRNGNAHPCVALFGNRTGAAQAGLDPQRNVIAILPRASRAGRAVPRTGFSGRHSAFFYRRR